MGTPHTRLLCCCSLGFGALEITRMDGNESPRYVAVYDPAKASLSNLPLAHPELWPAFPTACSNVADLKRQMVELGVTRFTNFTLDVMHPTQPRVFLSEATFVQNFDNKLPEGRGKLVVRIVPDVQPKVVQQPSVVQPEVQQEAQQEATPLLTAFTAATTFGMSLMQWISATMRPSFLRVPWWSGVDEKKLS